MATPDPSSTMAMKTRKRLAGHRVTRRQLKRDPFVDRVFDWALWSRENARKLAVAAGAVVLVLLAGILYRQSRASEARQAAERYEQVWQAYVAGNYQLAANDFRQFRTQYGGTDLDDEAALYLADSQFRIGDYPAAIRTLQDFRAAHADSPLRYAASALLGSAYEASGDWVKAAEAHRDARAAAQFDFQRVDARMNEARALQAAGQTDGAITAYRAVSEEHPDEPRTAEARVRLAELTVKPLRSDAAPAPDSAAVPPGAAPAPAEATDLPQPAAPTAAGAPGASPATPPVSDSAR